MGIFDRMGKVISSNLNSLLDKAEDTQKSVDLLIEEMHDQIRRGRQEVVGAVATEKQLRAKVEDLDKQVEKWQHRAELAIKVGDEPLAREALVQKKRIVEQRDQAEANRSEQRAEALRMKDELERAEAKLKQLEARKGTIVAQYEQARAGGGAEALGAKGDGPTPFDELRKIEDKMERASVEKEAMQEAQSVLKAGSGALNEQELEAKFSRLEGGEAKSCAEDDVDEELKALRKKMRVMP
jgi:phage shock protein A